MRRRTFLQVVLGLFAAPVVAKLPPAERLTTASYPLVIDQMRGTFGVSIREKYKADLAQWLANEFDRKALEALTGRKSQA